MTDENQNSGNGQGESRESQTEKRTFPDRKSPGTWPDNEKMRDIIFRKAGIVTQVAKAINMDRRTIQRRIVEDDEFRLWFQETRDYNLDQSEAVIYDAIDRKNLTATIFHLKCFGKKRGWVERHEITGADGKDLGIIDPRKIADGIQVALADPAVRKMVADLREQIDARTIALMEGRASEAPQDEDAVLKH